MPSISLPISSYTLTEPRAASRRLVNCFSEPSPTSGQNDVKNQDTPLILRRAPGIQAFYDTGLTDSPVRGMWVMQGILYAVIGSKLYRIDINGSPTIIGTGILGSKRVLMSDNGYCLVIIAPELTNSGVNPGDNVGFTYTTAGAFAPITDLTFLQLGAINLGFIDSYIVFLAANGREFYNCDSQSTSGTGPITFTSAGGTEFVREFGTDPFVGMTVLTRTILMIGQLTSEAFVDQGNQVGSPFTGAPNDFMEIGCVAGYTVVKQDGSAFWIAQDRTIRRYIEGNAVRVSTYAIESILEQADLTDAYAVSYSIGGHLMVAFTLPTSKHTFVYDCSTQQWHELDSYGLGYWRPYCTAQAYGKQMIGDSQAGRIGFLNTSIFSEFDVQQRAEWTHASIYKDHNRLLHQRLEIIMGTGSIGLPTTVSPQVSLYASDDGGNTFKALPTRSLGSTGQRFVRCVWYNLGMSRERVYRVAISDPVELWVVDAQLDYKEALH